MTQGSYDAKKLDLFSGFKAKSQLCAWMTSAAVCVEGFWVIRKSAAVCVEAYSCVRGFED